MIPAASAGAIGLKPPLHIVRASIWGTLGSAGRSQHTFPTTETPTQHNVMAATFESFESVSRRLRVVHSCDQCRARKIKCKVTPSQPGCDACLKQRSNCTFTARNQYLADDQRYVASHMSASGSVSTASSAEGTSSFISFTPSAPVRSGTPASLQAAQPSAAGASSSQQEYPPVSLMPHFIELFFKYYSASFPFITYEDVVSSFLQSTLSPLLSNAIASLASRYSQTMAQLALVDPATAPEYYAYQAKNLLRVLVNSPSIDTLRGIAIVAFVEQQSGRKDGFNYYAQIASNMARTLHLYDEATLTALSYGPAERQRLVALRDIAAQLPRLGR